MWAIHKRVSYRTTKATLDLVIIMILYENSNLLMINGRVYPHTRACIHTTVYRFGEHLIIPFKIKKKTKMPLNLPVGITLWLSFVFTIEDNKRLLPSIGLWNPI